MASPEDVWFAEDHRLHVLPGNLARLFGTLAQDEQNLEVVKAEYFNSIVAIVPFDVLLPITIFPHEKPLPGAFPFPAGPRSVSF